MRQMLAGLATLAATALPFAAGAAPGITTAPVYLRAGPSPAYPVVTTLPPNAQIEVFGCAEGWGWCDVAWGAARGWMSAGYLAFPHAGPPPGPLYQYGPAIGLTVIPFDFGPYWGRWYRDRPWYAERDRWGPPPPRYAPPPARPHPPGGPPPPGWRPPPGQITPPSPGPRPGQAHSPPGGSHPPPPQAGAPPRPSPHGGPPPHAGRPPQRETPPQGGRPPRPDMPGPRPPEPPRG